MTAFEHRADAEQPTTARPVATPDTPYARGRGQLGTQQLPPFDAATYYRYKRIGPPYTYYPSASAFAPIGAGLEASLLQDRDAKTPLSLYIALHDDKPVDRSTPAHITAAPLGVQTPYLHPLAASSTSGTDQSPTYLDDVMTEIEHKCRVLAMTSTDQPVVKQVHLTVGALTVARAEWLIDLWALLQTQFSLLPVEEGDYTIEIVLDDTDSTQAEAVKAIERLQQLPINRLSIAVQTLAHVTLASRLLAHAGAIPPTSISPKLRPQRHASAFDHIDMVLYGSCLLHSPNTDNPSTDNRCTEKAGTYTEGTDTLADIVTGILAVSPDRISIIDEVTPLSTYRAEVTPSLGQAIDALTEAGFYYIGMGHFVRPDDPLAVAQRHGTLSRNALGYSAFGHSDVIGFGLGAISQITTAHHRYGLQNPSDLPTYTDSLKAIRPMAGRLSLVAPILMTATMGIKTTLKDRLREYVIKQLICHDYLDFQDVTQKFGIDAVTYFIDEIVQLGPMQQDRLLDIDAAGVRILPKGRLLSGRIAMVFDPYHDDTL